MSESLLDPRVD